MRFKPKFDKLFYLTMIPTIVLVLALCVMTAIWQSIGGTILMVATVVFTGYFCVSPLFGFVELRETTVFVKCGFFLKREIPYNRMRAIETKRSVVADSMLALKNAMDHVNLKYNRFDVISVSVLDEDTMISELHARCGIPTKTDI